MRVSKKHLQNLLDFISQKLGRPSQSLVNKQWQIGALHLEYVACYGGWDMCEIINDKGAEHSLIGNTFGGRGRLTSREMETFLLGMMAALEPSQYWLSHVGKRDEANRAMERANGSPEGDLTV